jgi:hypothetical protein
VPNEGLIPNSDELPGLLRAHCFPDVLCRRCALYVVAPARRA